MVILQKMPREIKIIGSPPAYSRSKLLSILHADNFQLLSHGDFQQRLGTQLTDSNFFRKANLIALLQNDQGESTLMSFHFRIFKGEGFEFTDLIKEKLNQNIVYK